MAVRGADGAHALQGFARVARSGDTRHNWAVKRDGPQRGGFARRRAWPVGADAPQDSEAWRSKRAGCMLRCTPPFVTAAPAVLARRLYSVVDFRLSLFGCRYEVLENSFRRRTC